jgi:hypothetical protein
MSVRYKIAMHARQREKFAQQLGAGVSMPFRTRAMYVLAATHRQSVQDAQIPADYSPAAGAKIQLEGASRFAITIIEFGGEVLTQFCECPRQSGAHSQMARPALWLRNLVTATLDAA